MGICDDTYEKAFFLEYNVTYRSRNPQTRSLSLPEPITR